MRHFNIKNKKTQRKPKFEPAMHLNYFLCKASHQTIPLERSFGFNVRSGNVKALKVIIRHFEIRSKEKVNKAKL